jgi:hypothetical protein
LAPLKASRPEGTNVMDAKKENQHDKADGKHPFDSPEKNKRGIRHKASSVRYIWKGL